VVLSGQPFDTVKVRLQTQPADNPIYRGAWDCVKQTVSKEGVTGLYKGMGAPLVGVAPIFALSFMGFGLGKKLQQKEGETLGVKELALAGALSGFMTTVIMAPGERIKCILQVQQAATGPPKYAGPIDVVKSLYKEGGIKSIFRGSAATCMRDVPASAAYFASYELIQRALAPNGDRYKVNNKILQARISVTTYVLAYKKQITNNYETVPTRSQLSVLNTVMAGGLAGICNWLVAIPPDVLKSRLQAAPEGTYTGAMDVFRKLMKNEGPRSLYKGAVPVLLRAFPANAFCFLGYEVAMYGLNKVVPDW